MSSLLLRGAAGDANLLGMIMRVRRVDLQPARDGVSAVFAVGPLAGPLGLVDGTVVSSNATIHFSPKGFAVPAGTITITSGREVRRLVVNILGRVRIASGPPP